MPKRSPPNPNQKPQFERFIEAAKQVEADETDKCLTDAIRKIAKTNPTPSGESLKHRKKT